MSVTGLVRILGTIFCFCNQSAPPSRALLKRQGSNSTLFSTGPLMKYHPKDPDIFRLFIL
uniref:Uncharacterized protein n=1 Tax=Oryctolagus cuniculus TaxID=9986 RepID=A0A5F9DKN8_RABIT